MLNANAGGKKLDIPLNSKFSQYAGICMAASFLLMLVSNMRTNAAGIITSIFLCVPFIVIALLPKKNVALFIIPLAITALLNVANIFQGFPRLILELCYIALLVVFILITGGSLNKKKDAFYICGAIVIAAVLARLFPLLALVPEYGFGALRLAFSSLVEAVFFFGAYLLLILGLDSDPDKEYFTVHTTDADSDILKEEKSIGLCIVLSILTLGIYSLFWLYSFVKKIRLLDGDQKSFIGEYLCLILVPFYAIYWFYISSQKLYRGARAREVYLNDNKTLYLVLAIFIPIAAYAILQSDLNTIAKQLKGEIETKPQSVGVSAADSAPAATVVNNVSSADELLKFKELLDKGVITQEEFDAKKKQLLNL